MNIATLLALHDADIKALLKTLQDAVDVALAVQRQIIALQLTPEGQKAADTDLLNCVDAGTCPDLLAECVADPDGCVFNGDKKGKP